MPRPKKSTGTLLEWDVRITPTDQEEIVFNPSSDDFVMFLACKEISVNNILHYHLYCKTIRSETWLRDFFSKLGRANEVKKGNTVYSLRKAHEGTIGYVVKDGDVKCRLGCDDMFLEEVFMKSKQYRNDKEAERKRIQRKKDDVYVEIFNKTIEQMQYESFVTWEVISDYLVNKYVEFDVSPPRSKHESLCVRVMSKYDVKQVRQYYSRFLPSFN